MRSKEIGKVGLILILLVSGIVYMSDYRMLLKTHPDNTYIVIAYEEDSKIEVITRGLEWNTKQQILRWKYTKDEFVLYVDRYKALKEDWLVYYYKTYGKDEWVRLYRKPTKIKLYYDIDSDSKSITIIKETPYYATKSKKGTGGVLIQKATITDRSKFYNFPENYVVEWIPYGSRVKSDVKLVWRIRDFVPSPENKEGAGNGTGISFKRNVKIDWSREKDKFDYYYLNNTKRELLVYFKPQKGVQILNVKAFDPVVNLYLNGEDNSRYYELGSLTNLYANSTDGSEEVCIDIDLRGYGTNYSCGTGNVSLNITFQPNQFKFANNTEEVNLTTNDVVYIEFDNESVEVLDEAYLNLSGYNFSNAYPNNIQIDVGNDGVVDSNLLGTLNGTHLYVDAFSDGNTSKNFSFTQPSQTLVGYIELPRHRNITSAYFSVSAFSTGYIEQDEETECSGTFCCDDDWSTYDSATVSSCSYTAGDCISEKYYYLNYTFNGTVSDYYDIKVKVKFGKYRNWDAEGCNGHLHFKIWIWNYTSSSWHQVYYTNPSVVWETENSWYVTKDIDLDDEVNTNQTRIRIYIRASQDYPRAGVGPCQGTTTSARNFESELILYPYNGTVTNPYIDVGGDGDTDWNWTGVFKETNSPDATDNLADEFTDYLWSDECSNTICDVPILIYSETAGGVMQIDDIEIKYEANPVSLNVTALSNSLSNSVNVPINVTADTWGKVRLYGLDMPYNGSQNITVTAHSVSGEDSHNVSIVWSRFSKSLPYSWTDRIFFLPKTNSSKNVTPYGQTNRKPIINITWLNYDRNANISIRINETSSCMNITASTNSQFTDEFNLTDEYQTIYTNREKMSVNTTNIWLRMNLYNCSSGVITPWVQLKSCCVDCVPCW